MLSTARRYRLPTASLLAGGNPGKKSWNSGAAASTVGLTAFNRMPRGISLAAVMIQDSRAPLAMAATDPVGIAARAVTPVVIVIDPSSVIAEHGSMTAAAQAMGYTPGALSQQMNALRQAVGVELFMRQGRSLELTDHGRSLLDHARRILEAERLAARAVTGPVDELALRVDLGVFGSAAVVAIRPTMERLRQFSPNVTLVAREVDVEHMPDAVAAGDIDLALGLTYPAVQVPLPRGVSSVSLRNEAFLMALPPSLESVRHEPNLVDIANAYGWILPPPETDFGRAARLACAAAGIEPNVRHIVTDTAVSLAMAESGLGVTLATDLMLHLSAAAAVTSPLPGDSTRDVAAIYRRSTLERDSVRSVFEALREVFV